MAQATATRVFVIQNPGSGTYAAEALHAALERHFRCDGGSCDVHEVAGRQDLAAVARAAAARGVDIVVAAGGDGTVSAVANGLVGTEVPLGIIPLGTANVLARELMIPVDLEQACTLLGGEHAVSKIDAMEVAGKIYLTQVGIGIDALMIRDTKDADKRRFGRVAYLWTMAARLVGFQPRRFTLAVDGVTTKTQAIQVLLANCGTLGQPPLRWGEGIRPDDGVIDVCVVRAQTVWHFLKIAWNVARRTHKPDPNVSYLKARREVRIETTHPLLAQADGEVIGESPLTVRVVGGAVRVVVPL